MASESSYKLLSNSESLQCSRQQGHSKSTKRVCIYAISSIIICLLILLGTLFMTDRLTDGIFPIKDLRILKNPCGQSPAEAKARGCKWDISSFAWLPQECLDEELTAQFRAAGPWKFYGDQNKTVEVSEDDFGEDLAPVWLTNRLHVAHCAFSWLKFHRALVGNGRVHSQMPLPHTEHCSHILRAGGDLEELRTTAVIQYPDCGYFTTDFPGVKYPEHAKKPKRPLWF